MRNTKYITSPKSNNQDRRTESVTFILLAENHGYRMKSYGPISLIKLGEKTLLERQIEAITSVFINCEIIICSGFETAKLYNFIRGSFADSQCSIRIVENQVYYHSNCCESLRLCMSNTMNDKIVICGGGVLLSTEYLKSLDLRKSSIVTQDSNPESQFELGVIENGNRLENLSLAIKNPVWTDLVYINGKVQFNSLYNLLCKPELKNKFLFEAINSWSGKKNLQVVKNVSTPIVKISNIKTYKRINENEDFVS